VRTPDAIPTPCERKQPVGSIVVAVHHHVPKVSRHRRRDICQIPIRKNHNRDLDHAGARERDIGIQACLLPGAQVPHVDTDHAGKTLSLSGERFFQQAEIRARRGDPAHRQAQRPSIPLSKSSHHKRDRLLDIQLAAGTGRQKGRDGDALFLAIGGDAQRQEVLGAGDLDQARRSRWGVPPGGDSLKESAHEGFIDRGLQGNDDLPRADKVGPRPFSS